MSGDGRTPVIQAAVLVALRQARDGMDVAMLSSHLRQFFDKTQIACAVRYLVQQERVLRIGNRGVYRLFDLGVDVERAEGVVAVLLEEYAAELRKKTEARRIERASRRKLEYFVGPKRPHGTNQHSADPVSEKVIETIKANPGLKYEDLATFHGVEPRTAKSRITRAIRAGHAYTLAGKQRKMHCFHVDVPVAEARAWVESHYADYVKARKVTDRQQRAKAEAKRNAKLRAATSAKRAPKPTGINALADKFRGTATPKVKQEPKPVVITGMENAPKTVRKAPPGKYEVTGPIIGGLRTTPFGVYQTPPASAMARALGAM